MFEVGRLCVKTAGRDGGKLCVIVNTLEGGFFLVDGLTRRKKVNKKHLEPLPRVFAIKADADHATIISLFENELKIKTPERKPKQAADKPVKKRASASAAAKTKTTKKKAAKAGDKQ